MNSSDTGISFHKIIDAANSTFRELFCPQRDPLFGWIFGDMTKNADKFQRFFAGDMDWIFAKGDRLLWDHITGPIGTCAPRTYLEWEIVITIEGHREIAPVRSRQALCMWSPEFFPKLKRENLELKYVALEFTKRHPSLQHISMPRMPWAPDPALSCIWQELEPPYQLVVTVMTSKVADDIRPDNLLHDEYYQDAARTAYIYTKFVDFMKCSNVSLKNNPAPEKLNKKRLARGGIPIFSYKTLHIKSDRTSFVSADHGGTHSSPRQHFRRGHVRRLSEEKTVWVSSCMVGSAERGVVKKDYEVVGR